MIPLQPVLPSLTRDLGDAPNALVRPHNDKADSPVDLDGISGSFERALDTAPIAIAPPGDANTVVPTPVAQPEKPALAGQFLPQNGKAFPQVEQPAGDFDESLIGHVTMPDAKAEPQPVNNPVILGEAGTAQAALHTPVSELREMRAKVLPAAQETSPLRPSAQSGAKHGVLDHAGSGPTSSVASVPVGRRPVETREATAAIVSDNAKSSTSVGTVVLAVSEPGQATDNVRSVDRPTNAPGLPVKEFASRSSNIPVPPLKVVDGFTGKSVTESHTRMPVETPLPPVDKPDVQTLTQRTPVEPIQPNSQFLGVQVTIGETTPVQAGALNATPAASSASTAIEPRSDTRALPKVEHAIEQLVETRETVRSSRPEILLRHAEFGLVNMRLEANGGDLRATLASRDPGFVPAIQAALSERAVTASSDASATHSQRGHEHSSGGSSSGWLGGSNGGSEQQYGSSRGSAQGSLQPRLEQLVSLEETTSDGDHLRIGSAGQPEAGGRGVFA